MTIDVSPVRDVEHEHDASLVIDAVDDSIRASPGAMTTVKWADQRFADALRVLGEWTGTEFENRRRDRLG
jgi:hypothetical protein